MCATTRIHHGIVSCGNFHGRAMSTVAGKCVFIGGKSMAKFIDFNTVYGKLGLHPGNLTTEQAVALFDRAMKCKEGALLLDQWPDAGRTSVLLATVARNLDGKLKVVTRWETAPPVGPQLFERVYRTHK